MALCQQNWVFCPIMARYSSGKIHLPVQVNSLRLAGHDRHKCPPASINTSWAQPGLRKKTGITPPPGIEAN